MVQSAWGENCVRIDAIAKSRRKPTKPAENLPATSPAPKGIWANDPARPRFEPASKLSANQKAFLTALSLTNNITISAHLAGIARQRVPEWRESKPLFVEEEQRAVAFFADVLVEEARRRAFEGENELVLHQGRPVFVWLDANGQLVPDGDSAAVSQSAVWKNKKDPNLLMFLIKKERPEYRDNPKVIINQPNGNGGTAITPDQIVVAMDSTIPMDESET